MFAKVIYIIAMIPFVNVLLLGILLVGTVWAMSRLATYLRSRNAGKGDAIIHYANINEAGGDDDGGKMSVSPHVFNIFWLLVCVIIILSIGTTTETLLFAYTDGQNVWAFGSLLALTLFLVPVETFVRELYSALVPKNSQHSLENRENSFIVFFIFESVFFVF